MSRLQAGNATRRRILQAGLAAFGGAVVVGPALAEDSDPAQNQATERSAPPKLTQEAVQYQPTPKAWQKCLYCTYFQEPDTCAIVAGTVSPRGWCTHFALAHE